MPSSQRNYNEPSLSKRRALAETITSPRQLVKSKGEAQYVLTRASNLTHTHVSQSTGVMLSCGNEKRIKDLKDSFKDKKLSTKNKASFHGIMKPETAPCALKSETSAINASLHTSHFTLHTSRNASPHSTFFPHLLRPIWEKTNSFVRT